MKGYICRFILIAAAVTAVASSCRRAGDAADGDTVVASFHVAPQGFSSRASLFEDGQDDMINRFVMEVWCTPEGSSQLERYDRQVQFRTTPFQETTFDVKLVRSQEYQILFWADCAESAEKGLYYDASSLLSVNFSPNTYVGNTDTRYAFCNCVKVEKNADSIGGRVELTRPFGQVNFITKDIKKIAALTGGANVVPDSLNMKFQAPTSYNVMDGTVLGDKILLSSGAKPYYILRVGNGPSDGSDTPPEPEVMFTLTMDYIFASPTKTMESFELITFNDDEELVNVRFDNIPYMRNWRTNVIGDLLTEDHNFKVYVSDDWSKPDYEFEN